MEYMIVKYSRKRAVYMDTKFVGYTGDTLCVEEGQHIVDLGLPRDYQLEQQWVTICDTDPLAPCVIEFVPKEHDQ